MEFFVTELHQALVSLGKQVYCQPQMYELYRGVRGHVPLEKKNENWTLENEISCIPWIERS